MLRGLLTCSLERVWELRALEGGGAESAPSPAISAPVRARNTKFEGKIGPYKKSSRCKFGDPRSIFPWLNEVIIAKFSHFPVKSAGLQLSRSGAQTMTDSDKRGKKNEQMRNETADMRHGLRFDLRSTV